MNEELEKGEPAKQQKVHRRGTILVFSTDILPASQTFVRDHVRSLRDFEAVLVGTRRTNDMDLTGVATAIIPQSRFSRLKLYLFGISSFLDRLVQQRGVVAIHAHFTHGGMRIAAFARRKRLPLIVTLHGSDILRPRRQDPLRQVLFSFLERRLQRTADQFLAVADHLRRAAIARGYPPQRIRRHFLGIPLSDEVASAPRKQVSSPPKILFVGRLIDTKGLSYLLEACHRLEERGCVFQLEVIGDGPLADEHRRQAQVLRSPVDFVGTLPPEEAKQRMVGADIFCLPSFQEGLGIALLEAQAAGLPIVAFDIESLRETIRPEVTGLLAPLGSAEAIADALQRLLEDADLRARMGAAGAAFVREQFDIRERSRELETLYATLIEEGS